MGERSRSQMNGSIVERATIAITLAESVLDELRQVARYGDREEMRIVIVHQKIRAITSTLASLPSRLPSRRSNDG